MESAYEFMLAYAAQGLPSDAGSKTGAQIRDELRRLAGALDGIGSAFGRLLDEDPRVEAPDEQRAFVEVLSQDAQRALAAIRAVQGQSAISSQLVDNLNATIHLRALLTDVFLVDEILKILGSVAPTASLDLEVDG